MTDFKKYFYNKIEEDSTKDAKETLDAILGFLNDKDKLTDKEEEIRDMGVGMMDFYSKKKSFSPDQAKWIYNTSKAFFESYKEDYSKKINESESDFVVKIRGANLSIKNFPKNITKDNDLREEIGNKIMVEIGSMIKKLENYSDKFGFSEITIKLTD